MNNTKTILAAVGGATLVAIVAAGYFAWSQQAAKTAAIEGDDQGAVGLDSVREKAERLSRKPIYPSAESVKAITVARDEVNAWKEEAFALASRGDRRIAPTTDAAFKSFIVGDARRLQGLPAGQDAKTLGPEFDFGPFKPYIAEGKIPEQEQLKELQRKWDDVATIIETLSGCGVDKVTTIEIKTEEKKPVEESKPKKGRARPVKKAAAAVAPAGSQPAAYTYVVACAMRPEVFAKTLNALAASERFMAVSDFELRREKDTIAEALGSEKKEESASAPVSGRRRRRAAAAAEETKPEEKPAGEELFTVVTDPAEEAPLNVKLTIAVYDFRSGEESKEGEETK